MSAGAGDGMNVDILRTRLSKPREEARLLGARYSTGWRCAGTVVDGLVGELQSCAGSVKGVGVVLQSVSRASNSERREAFF